MGSATTQALAATVVSLDAAASVDLTVAAELFAAARALGDSAPLRSALANGAAPAAARAAVVADVFGPTCAPTTVSLLTAASASRWSSASDLVDGIEELAIRAAVRASDSADVEGELFWFSRTVADNPELEMALGSRMGDVTAKSALVKTLLDGRASEATILVASSLVCQPGDRRVRAVLSRALDVASEQRGRAVATVTSASPLRDEQIERLSAALSKRYGTDVAINVVVDPTIVGGLRVGIGNDLIDASVASRLADLRQRLAG